MVPPKPDSQDSKHQSLPVGPSDPNHGSFVRQLLWSQPKEMAIKVNWPFLLAFVEATKPTLIGGKVTFQEPTGGPWQAIVDPMPNAPFPTVLVELRGKYQGMGMPSPRDGMAFLAAIVRAPGREILHIRLTGPEATVDAAREDWLAFVGGLSIVGEGK